MPGCTIHVYAKQQRDSDSAKCVPLKNGHARNSRHFVVQAIYCGQRTAQMQHLNLLFSIIMHVV